MRLVAFYADLHIRHSRLLTPVSRPPESNCRKTQEPSSRAPFRSVVIIALLTFSLPLHLPRCLGWYRAICLVQ